MTAQLKETDMKKTTAMLIGAAVLAASIMPLVATPAEASVCLRITRGTNICLHRPTPPWFPG
jgi:hypothetical protein